jgi:putative membrane protein
VLCVAVFAAINQAFVAVSGRRRGWIASIAFAMLQVVSIGGLVPIDTAPAPFQLLNKVLPVSRAVDGFAHLTLGGQVGSLPADITVLVLWAVGALLLSTLAARRAQRIDVADLAALDADSAEARVVALK